MDDRTGDAPVTDALIVGGGPAGLAAATYLGRFRRRALIYDAGGARALLIPKTHNCPGFPDGIAGPDLVARLKEQAERYGAVVRKGRVQALRRAGELFEVKTPDGPVLVRKVVLATGVEDGAPPIADWRALVRQGLVRICPVCDAYEVTGRPVAVLGQGTGALKEAIFLRHYTPRISVISMAPCDIPAELRHQAAAAGIEVWDAEALDRTENGFRLRLQQGGERQVDAIYAAMGCRAESELAAGLGIDCSDDGSIITGAHQETSVAGVYAVGDVVEALNQMAVAFGHAALAATHIHNTLREAATA